MAAAFIVVRARNPGRSPARTAASASESRRSPLANRAPGPPGPCAVSGLDRLCLCHLLRRRRCPSGMQRRAAGATSGRGWSS